MQYYCLLIIMVNIPSSISQRVVCLNASSCVGDTINTTNGDDTFGAGYKSLFGPTTSINGEGVDAVAQCYGAYSCSEISFIIEEKTIRCYGSSACSKSNNLYISGISGGSIQCNAANSCQYSNLRGNHSEKISTNCFGDRSCNYATFKGIRTLTALGAYSLYGAVFNSSGATGDVTINLKGYYAGFGATIICDTGTNCIINCYGNGCFMLYIECTNNCIINKASNNTITPITNLLNYNSLALNILYDSFVDLNEAACNTAPELNVFDNWRMTPSNPYSGPSVVVNIDNTGPICCRGYQACQRNKNIQFNTTLLDTTNDVICNGYHTCSEARINNMYGSVFCDSPQACYGAVITAKNVYCLAPLSCKTVSSIGHITSIYNAENVYCSSDQSCAGTSITSSGDINIYLLGSLSGASMEIYCSENDNCFILCGAYNACNNIIFYCNGTCTASCVPDSGCPPSLTISPTLYPTRYPTTPTLYPASNPTNVPSYSTNNPTNPTSYPTYPTTMQPSDNPTTYPTNPTTMQPSDSHDTDAYGGELKTSFVILFCIIVGIHSW